MSIITIAASFIAGISFLLLVLNARRLLQTGKGRHVRRRDDENDRNQQELDFYLSSNHSLAEIGLIYERQIGYLYESGNYEVFYNGARNGVFDRGRDLIVRKGREILIIQAKCWTKKKFVPLSQIYQLYGSAKDYEIEKLGPGQIATPVFISTIEFSPVARKAAERLGIKLINQSLDKTYPMIKCNNSLKGEKIYHLPTDPYYDKIKIRSAQGDFYAQTVAEAVSHGFRRARNYRKTG